MRAFGRVAFANLFTRFVRHWRLISKISFALVATVAAAVSSPAAANWVEPGIYIVWGNGTPDGPYPTQEACETGAAELASGGERWECLYLAHNPKAQVSIERTQASSAAAQVDCFWRDHFTCLDKDSVRHDGDQVSYTLYMCWSELVGPPTGRCDTPSVVRSDCKDAGEWHDETYRKLLCPSYNPYASAHCVWGGKINPYCADENSIRRDGDRGTYTEYLCFGGDYGEGKRGPDERCYKYARSLDCKTGKGDVELSSQLGKELCPTFDQQLAVTDRCVGWSRNGTLSEAEKKALTNEQGIAACSELIDAAPRSKDTAQYYFHRGEWYQNDRRDEEALRDYRAAIALDPSEDTYEFMSSVHDKMKRYDLAIADLNEGLRAFPGNMTLLNYRASEYRNAKRYPEELADLTTFISANPDSWSSRAWRAELLISTKRYAAAFADSNRIIELQPSFAEGYYLRSIAELGLGRASAAKGDLAKARELMPNVEQIYSASIQAATTPAHRSLKHK